MTHPSILIVEDDDMTRTLLAARLADVADVTTVGTKTGARQLLAEHATSPFFLIILDLGLPDGWGLGLLPDIKQVWPDQHVFVLTGLSSASIAGDALALGANAVMSKEVESIDRLHRWLARQG